MHQYLKSIGFFKNSRMKDFIYNVVEDYDEMMDIKYPDGVFTEYTKFFDHDHKCGITVCGFCDAKPGSEFEAEYAFPFFQGTGITTRESVEIEQHSDKEAFAGICDDLRVGVSLIFYLQNAVEYMREEQKHSLQPERRPVTLSGLARDGKILFPVEKDKEAVKVERELTKNRNHLMAAARNGDEEAMESLTMDDMDTYSMISQRIATDDVFTIVDSYFMPYGVECDQYNILGEILDYMTFENFVTKEEICQLTVECNDMKFDICIAKKELLGEPEIGRRFKGVIWLQGKLHL